MHVGKCMRVCTSVNVSLEVCFPKHVCVCTHVNASVCVCDYVCAGTAKRGRFPPISAWDPREGQHETFLNKATGAVG